MDWTVIFLFWFIYSFLGWIVETLYCSIRQGSFADRGFLSGPICPIYGVGSIYVIFLVDPYVKTLGGLFLLSMVTTSILEYITSYIMEKLFAMRWWDYSERKFNINGRVCLENSIYFGILSILLINWIHPYISLFVQQISDTNKNYMSIFLFAIILLDIAYSSNAAIKLNSRFKEIYVLKEEIRDAIGRDNIEEKIEIFLAHGQRFIEEKHEDWMEFKENINANINEFKDHVEVDLSTLPLYKKIKELQMGSKFSERRILRAFPKLKSLKYNDVLEELKRNIKNKF
ncbi:putative ABC transporter permease [Alkalibaculum bacchi]|jgi:uncharacterized membrane protein|uniref:putative ABC transporter permease n=1 Tax=Alkalibaculum bacchi TaxID=645887 RepID=UPI0026E92B55|nr:putative ABC transporter permease [Alkalibaculum bacchi]